MKTQKKLLFPLVILAYLLSSYFNMAVASCLNHADIKKCLQDLGSNGRDLKARGQGSGLTHQDETNIKHLGAVHIPNYKMIKSGAVSTLGFGFKKGKPGKPEHFDQKKPELILLNSLSGEKIRKCVGSACDVRDDYPLPPVSNRKRFDHIMVKNAITASKKPITITRKINGVDKEVTYLVTVQAVYEGSYCQTTFFGGLGYTYCFDRFW